MITTVCKISYGSQTVPPIVPAVQGDTGRAISFEIADFTPPAGATATYFILKPSGEAIYNSATITDNSILCELTAQSLAEAGENRMQVRVLHGEDIVTSFEVILMVRTFLGDDAMESGTEMNIFDQAVEQATEQFQENAEQIVEEVIESIPADYTELTEEVDELNERLSYQVGNYNSYDLLKPNATYTSRTSRGVTFTWNNDNTECSASGTATGGSAWTNLFIVTGNNKLPDGMVAGGTYYIHLNTTDSNFCLTFGIYKNGTYNADITFVQDGVLTVPSDCSGMYIRLMVLENATVDATISDIAILTAHTNNELESIFNNTLLDYTHAVNSNVLPTTGDANDYTGNNVYMVSAPNQIDNLPSTDAGVLVIYKVYNFAFQFFTSHTASGESHMFVRRCTLSSSTWTDWKEIGHGVSQIINQYSNTYNISTSPTITTDTNNFLSSTNDNTDRTSDIMSMLTDTGICHLGPGVFYVSGIDMPNDTTLEGSGSATEIILLGTDSTEGYAIKVGSRCIVKNMSVKGNTADHTGNNDYYNTSAEYVNRHGLLWQGNFSTDNNNIPRRAVISGLCISNFTGGGITCVDTGTNVSASFSMSDTLIWYCYAGINIQYSSEYNRFVNVAVTNCLYGIINNGGNNLFTNCNVSNNNTGVLMDDTNGKSPNNSHGSFIGCAFNHNGQNSGYAFILIGLDSGEIFSACQIFYGKTQITECKGIRFVGCNFGRQTGISVSNSYAVTFDSCQFREATDTPVTDTSNTGFKFTNCMLYSGSDFSPLT